MQQEIAERLKEARSKLNKVKNDKDFFAFQTALSNKNDPDIMEAYKQIKAGKERLMKHECHKCDMKFKHLDILHRRFKLV